MAELSTGTTTPIRAASMIRVQTEFRCSFGAEWVYLVLYWGLHSGFRITGP